MLGLPYKNPGDARHVTRAGRVLRFDGRRPWMGPMWAFRKSRRSFQGTSPRTVSACPSHARGRGTGRGLASRKLRPGRGRRGRKGGGGVRPPGLWGGCRGPPGRMPGAPGGRRRSRDPPSLRRRAGNRPGRDRVRLCAPGARASPAGTERPPGAEGRAHRSLAPDAALAARFPGRSLPGRSGWPGPGSAGAEGPPPAGRLA